MNGRCPGRSPAIPPCHAMIRLYKSVRSAPLLLAVETKSSVSAHSQRCLKEPTCPFNL